jgi:predicted regulator of Ras-like GTPase activity (Roadblock/LC7/MglB family)
MRGTPYDGLLAYVMSMPGIRGSLVVAVRDGLVVAGRVHIGVHGAAVAALAASLYRRACRATGEGETGSRFVEIEASQGRIMIAGKGDLALMAVVESRANAGQARLAVRRAAEGLVPTGGPA